MSKIKIGVTLLCGVCCASGASFATTTRSMPASGCHAYTVDDGDGAASFGSAGRVRNLNVSGSQPVEVICPLVRVDTANTNGVSAASAYVFRSAANADVLSCTLNSTQNVNGTPYVKVMSTVSSTNGTGTQFSGDFTLNFALSVNSSNVTSMGSTTGPSTGLSSSFYAMFCHLPQNGDTLYGYAWSEP
jgi:hypothetical protein